MICAVAVAEARFVNAVEREPVDVTAVPDTRKSLVSQDTRMKYNPPCFCFVLYFGCVHSFVCASIDLLFVLLFHSSICAFVYFFRSFFFVHVVVSFIFYCCFQLFVLSVSYWPFRLFSTFFIVVFHLIYFSGVFSYLSSAFVCCL